MKPIERLIEPFVETIDVKDSTKTTYACVLRRYLRHINFDFSKVNRKTAEECFSTIKSKHAFISNVLQALKLAREYKKFYENLKTEYADIVKDFLKKIYKDGKVKDREEMLKIVTVLDWYIAFLIRTDMSVSTTSFEAFINSKMFKKLLLKKSLDIKYAMNILNDFVRYVMPKEIKKETTPTEEKIKDIESKIVKLEEKINKIENNINTIKDTIKQEVENVFRKLVLEAIEQEAKNIVKKFILKAMEKHIEKYLSST